MDQKNSDGDHKVTIVMILSMVEFLSVKHAGLVMRELKKDPNNLFDRFTALMIEFENEVKIDQTYQTILDKIFESWKKNGHSVKFDNDVRELLLDEEQMPIYLKSTHTKELVRLFALQEFGDLK